MRTSKALLFGVVLAIVAISTTACGGADNAGADDETGTIGIVLISGSDNNTVTAMEGFRAAAEEAGWETVQIDAEGEPEKANTAIQNLVQRNVDGIVTTIFPAAALAAGLRDAEEAGIPVINHGGGPGPGVDIGYSVAGDGEMVRAMFDDLGGRGEILAYTYPPGLPCLQREQNLDAVLSEYPDIKVTKQEVQVEDVLGSSATVASGWLASRPEGSTPLAVWGCWDGPALGAISALKRLGRDDVKVYGYNTDKDAQDAIRAGDMTGSTWFETRIAGRQEFDQIVELIRDGGSDESREIQTPSVYVTATNLDDFLAEHPEAAA